MREKSILKSEFPVFDLYVKVEHLVDNENPNIDICKINISNDRKNVEFKIWKSKKSSNIVKAKLVINDRVYPSDLRGEKYSKSTLTSTLYVLLSEEFEMEDTDIETAVYKILDKLPV